MTTVPSLLVAAATLALAAPAGAAMLDSDPFTGIAAMSPAELGSHRGGMMINGIPMDFAVVVKTTVDGALSQGLQTVLAVTPQGGLASATTTPIGTTTGATLAPTADGGMSFSLPSGTTILHQVEQGQIQTLIANSRSDVSLNNRTEVNVDLPGFHALTQTWYGSSRAAQMGIDAARMGVGRF